MINKKLQKYTEKMLYRHPPIQEHLVYSHLICLHMYIHVIFTGHICVYIMPFSEVTILFNQHFHYCREYRGKIPDGHSKPIYFVLKPLNLQILDEFSTVPLQIKNDIKGPDNPTCYQLL